MNTTLVINRKGGAGKTTVTINLASCFATRGISTTIMDYDPQGSSLHWLKSRDPRLARIHGANAAPQKFGLRSFGMWVPADTRELLIDAPGGVSGVLLQELVGRANCILIPVTPSTIDIHATANFIRDLYRQILSRSPSADEVAGWIAHLRSTPQPWGAGQMAHGFFDGPENLSKPTTLARYVRLLYVILLGREPALLETPIHGVGLLQRHAGTGL